MICKTDRMVIGFIMHEIRKELSQNINFFHFGTTRSTEDEAKPRQILYYLSDLYCGLSSKLAKAQFLKTTWSNFRFAQITIKNKMEDNRTFQYMMRRISSKIEKRIEKQIDLLTP